MAAQKEELYRCNEVKQQELAVLDNERIRLEEILDIKQRAITEHQEIYNIVMNQVRDKENRFNTFKRLQKYLHES